MADDIVISARVDTTEALRDLAKLEQDRTVDVEVQPINVEATIKAIHVHPGGQIEAKDLLIELE